MLAANRDGWGGAGIALQLDFQNQV